MDFGIARMRSSDVRTKTGILLGSPKYMSPEQVLGQDVDGRSDIFSLGVVLHEMLTGATPFSGETVTGLMHQIATAPATPPSRANAEVPQMLDFIVAKALVKMATERYQSAAELAADLRECATHLSPIIASEGERKRHHLREDRAARPRDRTHAAPVEPLRFHGGDAQAGGRDGDPLPGGLASVFSATRRTGTAAPQAMRAPTTIPSGRGRKDSCSPPALPLAPSSLPSSR